MPFKRKTKQQFVEDCLEVHGSFYSYEKSEYLGNHIKVIITCPIHSDFSMTPSNHLAGQDCPECAKVKHSEKCIEKGSKKFIIRMKEKYGEKYDFSKSIFLGDKIKVEVVCQQHGSFWATPSNLLRGRQCPCCQENGYRPNKAGYFYIFYCDGMVKVGITNNRINDRLQRIRKSSKYDFKVHSHIFSDDGYFIKNLEKSILNWLRENYKNVDEKFEGYTECFVDVDIEQLLSIISPLAKEGGL